MRFYTRRIILKSKIHGDRVTDVNIDYEGSITIDKSLMAEAGITATKRAVETMSF